MSKVQLLIEEINDSMKADPPSTKLGENLCRLKLELEDPNYALSFFQQKGLTSLLDWIKIDHLALKEEALSCFLSMMCHYSVISAVIKEEDLAGHVDIFCSLISCTFKRQKYGETKIVKLSMSALTLFIQMIPNGLHLFHQAVGPYSEEKSYPYQNLATNLVDMELYPESLRLLYLILRKSIIVNASEPIHCLINCGIIKNLQSLRNSEVDKADKILIIETMIPLEAPDNGIGWCIESSKRHPTKKIIENVVNSMFSPKSKRAILKIANERRDQLEEHFFETHEKKMSEVQLWIQEINHLMKVDPQCEALGRNLYCLKRQLQDLDFSNSFLEEKGLISLLDWMKIDHLTPKREALCCIINLLRNHSVTSDVLKDLSRDVDIFYTLISCTFKHPQPCERQLMRSSISALTCIIQMLPNGVHLFSQAVGLSSKKSDFYQNLSSNFSELYPESLRLLQSIIPKSNGNVSEAIDCLRNCGIVKNLKSLRNCQVDKGDKIVIDEIINIILNDKSEEQLNDIHENKMQLLIQETNCLMKAGPHSPELGASLYCLKVELQEFDFANSFFEQKGLTSLLDWIKIDHVTPKESALYSFFNLMSHYSILSDILKEEYIASHLDILCSLISCTFKNQHNRTKMIKLSMSLLIYFIQMLPNGFHLFCQAVGSFSEQNSYPYQTLCDNVVDSGLYPESLYFWQLIMRKSFIANVSDPIDCFRNRIKNLKYLRNSKVDKIHVTDDDTIIGEMLSLLDDSCDRVERYVEIVQRHPTKKIIFNVVNGMDSRKSKSAFLKIANERLDNQLEEHMIREKEFSSTSLPIKVDSPKEEFKAPGIGKKDDKDPIKAAEISKEDKTPPPLKEELVTPLLIPTIISQAVNNDESQYKPTLKKTWYIGK